jgi:spore cortex biosynthesis protein YabQ
MLTLDLQLYAVLVMVLTGVILALLFDIHRGARGAFLPGPVATVLGDILYWVTATLIIILALVFSTWGEVRAFTPVGAAIGILIYRWLATDTVVLFTRWLLRALGRDFVAIARIAWRIGLVANAILRTIIALLLLALEWIGRLVAVVGLSLWAVLTAPFRGVGALFRRRRPPGGTG